MLIMAALKQWWNFTRQYSVPRTAKGQRDLPLSDGGTGAGLQCKQCSPLVLGWPGVSCPSLLLLPGTCSEFVTAVSTSAKQALQQLTVLRAVVTQPLPWMILLSAAFIQQVSYPPASWPAERAGKGRHFFGCSSPITALVLGPTRYAVCWRRVWDRCSVLQLRYCGCYGIPITRKTVIQKWCSLCWLCISLPWALVEGL